MPLSGLEELQISRSLLEMLRWRLADKPGPIIPPGGQYYFGVKPHDRCALGSIAHLPDSKDIQSGVQPMPNSMGLVFIAQPPEHGPLVLEVEGRFDLVHAYIPRFEDQCSKLVSGRRSQELADAYIRHTVSFAPARFEIAAEKLSGVSIHSPVYDTLQVALREHLAEVSQDPRVCRRLALEKRSKKRRIWSLKWSDKIFDQDTLNAAVHDAAYEPDSGPLPYELDLQCRVRRAPTPVRSMAQEEGLQDQYLVQVFLTNKTERAVAERYNLRDHRVMDVNLRVRIIAGAHRRMRFPVAPEEYRYAPLQDSDGYGVTCALVRAPDGLLLTESLPTYEQPRVEASSPAEVGMRHAPEFARLAHDPFPTLDDFLAAMRAYARDWNRAVSDLEKRASPALDHVRGDLAKFEEEMCRAAYGVELLRHQRPLLRAFCLMNEAMLRAASVQREPFGEWYLFQLGFILTQIPDIAGRAPHVAHRSGMNGKAASGEAEVADALCYSTGGGKTEAYFGAIILEMFYQRLIGRQYGTTAWVRYPMRMLSVQQFQRLAFVVGAAEYIRVREHLPGFAFTIGYYTGPGTPGPISSDAVATYLPYMLRGKKPGNDSTGETSEDLVADEGTDAAENWQKTLRFIDTCPHCAANVRVELDPEVFRIKHVCTNHSCWSNRERPLKDAYLEYFGELGIYISDEECYRYIPTVMVGTLDKIVVMGHNPRFSNFFGAATHYCPDHGFIVRATCGYHNLRKIGDHWSERRPCRNNQSTSAVRIIRIAPMQDPGITRLVDDEVHLQRDEIGNFKSHFDSTLTAIQCSYPGGRPPKVLAVTATTRDIDNQGHHLYLKRMRSFPSRGAGLDANFYSRVKRDPGTGETLVRRFLVGVLANNTQKSRVAELACDANDHYHDLVAECTQLLADDPQRACRMLHIDVARAAVALEYMRAKLSTSLVYVRHKRNAEYVMRRFESDNDSLREAGREQRVAVRLDAETPLAHMQQTVATIQARQACDPPYEMVATSVFSCGVDLKVLNIQVFVHRPTTTAEYIQASSRCGRVHTGIVLVVHDARVLVEAKEFAHFEQSHRFIERLIEPVPINRFASKVLLRTLPSVFCALMFHWASRQPWGAGTHLQARSVALVLNRSEVADKFAEMILEAYGFERAEGLSVFNARQLSDAKAYVFNQAQRLIGSMRRVHPHLAASYFKEALTGMWGEGPMRSLRDVEQQIEIKPATREDRQLFQALGVTARRAGPWTPLKVSASRCLYEDFLPGGVVALHGAYGKVVGIEGDTKRAERIPSDLLRDVIAEYVIRFEAAGGLVDETFREVVAAGQFTSYAPTAFTVSPFPSLLVCSEIKCRLVEAAPGVELSSHILSLVNRIDRVTGHVGCRECGAPLRQLPYVQIHRCGHLGSIELPFGARQRRVRFHAHDEFVRSTWSDFDTGENLGSSFQGECPRCTYAQERRNQQPMHIMAGTQIDGGRGDVFFSHVIQFVAFTPETTTLLTTFRAGSAEADLGRAIVCALLGLQDPRQFRENLRVGVGHFMTGTDIAKLKAERLKLETGIELLRKEEGLENVVAMLEKESRQFEERIRRGGGFFSTADRFINDERLLSEIGSNQRAAEAALIRAEFDEQTFDTDKVDTGLERHLLLDDRQSILLRDYGVREVRHIDNLEMVNAAIGFTRQAAVPHGPTSEPLRLNPLRDEMNPYQAGKAPIVALPVCSEGILIRFDPCRVLRWGSTNLHWPPPRAVVEDPRQAHAQIIKAAPTLAASPGRIRQLALSGEDRSTIHVLGLLHTLGHCTLRSARSGSGYDLNSLAEYIFPLDLSVLIYVASRKNFTMGGLRTLYDYGLLSWFSQAAAESLTCIFDPVCSEEGGSCSGCTQLPLGCETFNHGISRAYLHGGDVPDITGQSLPVREGFWA